MAEPKPIQNEKVAFTVIDEEAALLHPENSSLYWLNPTATRIWELADGRRTVQEMAVILSAEFDVDYETAVRDTQQMVSAFTEKRLLETAVRGETDGA